MLCLLNIQLPLLSLSHSFSLLFGGSLLFVLWGWCFLKPSLPCSLALYSYCFLFLGTLCQPYFFSLALSFVLGLLFSLTGQALSHLLLRFHHAVSTLTHLLLAQTSLGAWQLERPLQNEPPLFSSTRKPSVDDTFDCPALQDRSGFSLLCNPNSIAPLPTSHHEHDNLVTNALASALHLF